MRRERGNNSVLEGDNPAETALIWLIGPAVLLYGAYLLAGFLAGRIHCGAPTKPDSLFAPLGFLVGEHDPAAFGAMMECARRGISVPGDMAIAGFGNFEIAAVAEPSLTTIDPFPARIGAETGALIVRRLRDGAGDILHRGFHSVPLLRGA